jgi:hypothetical protein
MKTNPKSNAARQAEWRSRLRKMTPMERALAKNHPDANLPNLYTREELRTLELIRATITELERIVELLNRSMVNRLEADQKAPGRDILLFELSNYTRVQLPMF